MSGSKNSSRTLAGAFQTNLIKQLGKQRLHASKSTPLPTPERKPASVITQQQPASKYVATKAAYQHLGISRATFFRLKKQGHFTPSPVTGRYHLDDLDQHVRSPSRHKIKPKTAGEPPDKATERSPMQRWISFQPASIHLLPSTTRHSSTKIRL